ncbi:MAG: hypothetical protein L0322_07885 [Chloroflexi bacterium]|nr:hypothetical protein [Chloroflexota bacterium]MCI0576113.1 hypothetical protein [Chloroflexota bacterium]MCI0647901.1 hypothetical protein [Chloroflexota bacterium]
MSPVSVYLTRISRAWWLAIALLLVVLLLAGLGWWQGTAVGPQLQVPMFYDAHYLFPRPWTQAQEAPGLPDPAVVSALYGPNRVSQRFTSGMDRLAMVRLWLAGPAGTPVQVSLAGTGLVYGGEVRLAEGLGQYYELIFPPIARARGQSFTLTLYAPQATETRPVSTRSVGGDRLGGSLYLNEYPRPGNLELTTYGRGLPGRWWLQALGQQLLPDVFALRLQQYKPEPFKGAVFPALLGLTLLLSGVYLMLARPGTMPLGQAAGWGLAGLLLAFLAWQLLDGRLQLPRPAGRHPLTPQASAIPLAPGPEERVRLVYDLPSALWTARREPEARFVETGWESGWQQSAVRMPARSALYYSIVTPLNGRFRAGVVALTEPLRFTVRLGEQTVYSEEAPVTGEVTWLELDLAAWGGQGQTLALLTEPANEQNGEGHGLWLAPQVSAVADWLLPALPDQEGVQPVRYRLASPGAAGVVELAGYRVEPAGPGEGPEEALAVTFYWRALEPAEAQAAVFVHLLDETGQIIAQHDGQPVLDTYPLPTWQPGVVIADSHRLSLPAALPAGLYRLAVGLYDPDSLARWPVTGPGGERLPDGRVLLAVPAISEATP